MKNSRVLWWVVLLLVALLIVPVFRGVWFYRQMPKGREVSFPDLSEITVQAPRAGAYADLPQPGHGLVLFDRAHGNYYSPAEVSVLASRLNARGIATGDIDPYDDLAAALRPASALVVITPLFDFTPDEVEVIQTFVEKGGRLLLIADPTRFTVEWNDYDYTYELINSSRVLNALANAFELSFEEDYLYNVEENEGNYQNILLQQFRGSPLTEGLFEVAFYSTHSIHAPEGGLIIADGATRSSVSELRQSFAVAALDSAGQVLALGDLTFMTNPYADVLDNGHFISNIADFLAGAERRYEMADFPHFFGAEVDLVALVPSESFQLSPAQLRVGGELQQVFEEVERELVLQDEEDPDRDTLFIGLFDRAGPVAGYLEEAGISVTVDVEPISATLMISGIGDVDAAGMSLLYRYEEDGRQVLILLSDTGEDLEYTVEALSFGYLEGCFEVTETLFLCVVGEGGGGWDDGGDGDGGDGNGDGDGLGNSILIVADNDADDFCFTSSDMYYWALYLDYEVDEWYEYTEGVPSLADLQEYDAVIWSTGNCSNTAPMADEAEMLQQYVSQGGRLLIEGMRIGQDWSGSDFYAEVCHAEAAGTAIQIDIEVADDTHRLAEGFSQGEVIDFYDFLYEYDFAPDVIVSAIDAEVVFIRGPNSEEAGAPSILAYDGGESRVVYIAFPMFFMYEDDADVLIVNAVEWLLGR